MAHRTQIMLTDDQYTLLQRESERSGVSLAELIRRAVNATYEPSVDERRRGLEESFGAWKDREFDGATYVEQLRSPGLGARLEELWQR